MRHSTGSKGFLSDLSSGYSLRAPLHEHSLYLGFLTGRAQRLWCVEVVRFGLHVWQQVTTGRDDGSERAVAVRWVTNP